MDIDTSKIDTRLISLGLLLGLLNENLEVQENWFHDPSAELSKIGQRLHHVVALLKAVLPEAEEYAPASPAGASWHPLSSQYALGGLHLTFPKTNNSQNSGEIGLGIRSGQNATVTIHGHLPLVSYEPTKLSVLGNAAVIDLGLTVRSAEGKKYEVGKVTFTGAVIKTTIPLKGNITPSFELVFTGLDGSDKARYSSIGEFLDSPAAEWLEALLDGPLGYWLSTYVGNSALHVGDIFEKAGFVTLKDQKKYTFSGKLTSLLNEARNTPLLLAKKLIFATLQALADTTVPLISFGSGGINVAYEPISRTYGLRFVGRIPLSDGRHDADDYTPRYTLCLGAEWPGEAAAKTWTTAMESRKSQRGLMIDLIQVGENGAISFTPGISLCGIGLAADAPKGKRLLHWRGYGLDGLRADLYLCRRGESYDMGVAARLSRATLAMADIDVGGGGPAKEIVSKAGKAAKSDKKAEFSLFTAYMDKKFSVQLYDEKDHATDVIWLPHQDQYGPLHIDKLGVGGKVDDTDGPGVKVAVTGSLTLSAFRMDLMNGALFIPLGKPWAMQPSLDGLAVAANFGEVAISGGLGRLGDEKYAGELSVVLPKCSIRAVGLYETANGRTSFFVYGSFQSGTGIRLGAISIVGAALGIGVNRAITIPEIGDVADYPLVKMAMGADPRKSGSQIAQLEKIMEFKADGYFGCVGLSFIIGEAIKAAAIAVARLGSDIDFHLLGLATLEKTLPSSKQPLCHVELALKMALKPSEGSFIAQAELTGESWVLDKSCRLTGGFALAVWFGGLNKGDYVISLGGYHPKFVPPPHYPTVPRLGLNWQVSNTQVSNTLSLKGEMYFAVTPAMLMTGGRLEAAFSSGRVSAQFTAYVDFLMEWAPLHYEAKAGIAVRVQAKTFLKTLDVKVAATMEFWGSPFGGMAEIDVLGIFTFPVAFGEKRQEPPQIEKWEEFGGSFLDKNRQAVWTIEDGKDFAVNGPMLCQPLLVKGMAEPNKQQGGSTGAWTVRGEELEIALSTAMPLATVQKEQLGELPSWCRNNAGKSLVLAKPVNAKPGSAKVLDTSVAALGVRPMKKVSSLVSTMKVAVVCADGPEHSSLDLTDWTIEAEKSAVPAALWDTDHSKINSPGAKVIRDCITGLKRIRPPRGQPAGGSCGLSASFRKLEDRHLSMPVDVEAVEDFAALAGTQWEAERAALTALGFVVPDRVPGAASAEGV